MGSDPLPGGQAKGPQWATLLLSCRKTGLYCVIMVAAAIPEWNWSHWAELQAAFRASCLALQLRAPLRQSRRHIRVCQAERTLESQQGSGGLLGNPELPSSENRWCFSSNKVSSATFTSSECTWKDIKIFSLTSVTWHPQTADSHPCACFELRTYSCV